MRLATLRPDHPGDAQRAVVVTAERVLDCGRLLGASTSASMLELARSPSLLQGLRVAAGLCEASRNATIGSLDEVTLAAPIPDPGKVIAIGLNYIDHAAESGAHVPTEPLVFAKFSSAIIGPGAPITWDLAVTDAVDYEAELAVIIGRLARNVNPARALDHVFGYTCLNDVSARDLQFGDGQWVRGKSLDTFCPMGPWIVTADEIADPQTLGIECIVAGDTLQRATTADMYFGVADLIARLSAAFTLEPGDVIATGTPPGVGWFREPRRLLRHGDEVVVAIDAIGELHNPVVIADGR